MREWTKRRDRKRKREKRVKEEKRKNRAMLTDCGRNREWERETEQRQAEGGRKN